MGLAALGLPERADGVGGLAEVTTVCEELGRSLLPVPFLTSTVLAGQVLAAAGAAADEALTRVAAGEVAALGVTGPAGVWDPAAVELRADPRPAPSTASCPWCPWAPGRISTWWPRAPATAWTSSWSTRGPGWPPSRSTASTSPGRPPS